VHEDVQPLDPQGASRRSREDLKQIRLVGSFGVVHRPRAMNDLEQRVARAEALLAQLLVRLEALEGTAASIVKLHILFKTTGDPKVEGEGIDVMVTHQNGRIVVSEFFGEGEFWESDKPTKRRTLELPVEPPLPAREAGRLRLRVAKDVGDTEDSPYWEVMIGVDATLSDGTLVTLLPMTEQVGFGSFYPDHRTFCFQTI
jgi:hypothetical protein